MSDQKNKKNLQLNKDIKIIRKAVHNSCCACEGNFQHQKNCVIENFSMESDCSRERETTTKAERRKK